MSNKESSLKKQYKQCEAQLQCVISETEALAVLEVMSGINHKLYEIMQGDLGGCITGYD